MTIYPALQPYLDRGQLRAMLMQDALDEAVGEDGWEVDMPAGTLTFVAEDDPSRRMPTRAHLIASLAPGPGSMLWGWAHPQGEPGGPAAQLRAAGAADGVPELTEDELPFPDDFAADEQDIAALAHEIGTVATAVTDGGPYYSAPVGGGTRVVFLLEAPLPQLTLATAVAKLPRLLSSGLLDDARTSVWGLALGQGWDLQWTDDAFSGATVGDGVSTAEFAFDQEGRVTSISGQISGS